MSYRQFEALNLRVFQKFVLSWGRCFLACLDEASIVGPRPLVLASPGSWKEGCELWGYQGGPMDM